MSLNSEPVLMGKRWRQASSKEGGGDMGSHPIEELDVHSGGWCPKAFHMLAEMADLSPRLHNTTQRSILRGQGLIYF